MLACALARRARAPLRVRAALTPPPRAAATDMATMTSGVFAGAGGGARPAGASPAHAPRAPRALVPFAEGSEDVEFACIVDVLRRADVAVVAAGVGLGGLARGAPLTLARGLRVVADARIEELPADAPFDAVVLPGGMPGAARLAACPALSALLQRHAARGGLVGAICAAPAVVLAPAGLLRGAAEATAYPSFVPKLRAAARAADADAGADVGHHAGSGCAVVDDEARDVVVSRGALPAAFTVVTSRGPATALAFALQIVAQLLGEARARAVGEAMLVDAAVLARVAARAKAHAADGDGE